LLKKNVILDSEVPVISRSLCKFSISMTSHGKFYVEAKIQGARIAYMDLDLEDLLEKRDNRITKLENEYVILHIPSTLTLLNKFFLS